MSSLRVLSLSCVVLCIVSVHLLAHPLTGAQFPKNQSQEGLSSSTLAASTRGPDNETVSESVLASQEATRRKGALGRLAHEREHDASTDARVKLGAIGHISTSPKGKASTAARHTRNRTAVSKQRKATVFSTTDGSKMYLIPICIVLLLVIIVLCLCCFYPSSPSPAKSAAPKASASKEKLSLPNGLLPKEDPTWKMTLQNTGGRKANWPTGPVCSPAASLKQGSLRGSVLAKVNSSDETSLDVNIKTQDFTVKTKSGEKEEQAKARLDTEISKDVKPDVSPSYYTCQAEANPELLSSVASTGPIEVPTAPIEVPPTAVPKDSASIVSQDVYKTCLSEANPALILSAKGPTNVHKVVSPKTVPILWSLKETAEPAAKGVVPSEGGGGLLSEGKSTQPRKSPHSVATSSVLKSLIENAHEVSPLATISKEPVKEQPLPGSDSQAKASQMIVKTKAAKVATAPKVRGERKVATPSKAVTFSGKAASKTAPKTSTQIRCPTTRKIPHISAPLSAAKQLKAKSRVAKGAKLAAKSPFDEQLKIKSALASEPSSIYSDNSLRKFH